MEDLHRQLEQLRASRSRVVAAADAERRRIERELHDGVQQDLVALVVGLQLARQLLDADPAAATSLMDEIARDARRTLEKVRELAYEIYPPLLLDRGLAEALRGAGSVAGIPTRVEAIQRDRYSPDVEATVYFCCLEALRDAARHAGTGARATVRVWAEPDTLCFDVSADANGFEQAALGPGLTILSDRLGAQGGTLTIGSQPGGGTRISGTIPVQERLSDDRTPGTGSPL